MLKEIIVILPFLLFSIELDASETNILTLNDCIDLAIKNNYTILEEQIRLQNTSLDLDITKNAYYPKLNLEADAPRYTRYNEFYSSGSIEDYYNYNRIYNSLTARVSTEIPTGSDLNIGLQGINNYIDSETQKYKKDSMAVDYIFTAKIDHPLFRRNITAREISKKKEGLKNKKLNYDQTVKNIKHTITSSYFNLLESIKNHEIRRDLYEKSKLNYELGLKKVETGLIPEVDTLQLEVSFSRDQASLLEAGNRIKRNKESLLYNIGLSLKYPMNINKKITLEKYKIDFKRTLENTVAKDVSINNIQYSLYLNEEEHIKIKDDSNLNIYTSIFYNYYINKEPQPDNEVYNFGISLNFVYQAIDFGLSKKKLKRVKNQMKINRIKLRKRKIQLEKNLNELFRNIEENDKKISIYSNSINVAQKRYDINLKQFEDGVITTLDLLTGESDLNRSKISYLNAIINYKIKISEINRDYIVIYK